jgi:phage shock protein PspC (stress-responsive transcriptional regulator)
MSTFCSNCGSALPPTARFCSVCGSVVSGFPPAGYPPYAPRLVRPFHGRQFAGVCAAFARTYGWDLGLVRILTVIAGIFVFPLPEIFYIACWIGIPEEPVGDFPPPPQP